MGKVPTSADPLRTLQLIFEEMNCAGWYPCHFEV